MVKCCSPLHLILHSGGCKEAALSADGVCVCVCVCVCVLVYATLWGLNVHTRIVEPDIFDIVGTCLWSP